MNKNSKKYIDELKKFDTATISNSIEKFKVRDDTTGYSSMELKCLTPENKPMVGYAITATVDTTTPGPIKSRYEKLAELYGLIYKKDGPSVIVIKHVGSNRLRSCCFGDMSSKAAQRLGAAGLVTDCGIRDLGGIKKRAKDFCVFASGIVPSHGYGNFIEIGVTVSIFGLIIKPGDLLHGDENGLIKIPEDKIEIMKILEEAKNIIKQEKEIFDYLDKEKIDLKMIQNMLAPKD